MLLIRAGAVPVARNTNIHREEKLTGVAMSAAREIACAMAFVLACSLEGYCISQLQVPGVDP